ncbi:protein-arginine deiminase family protein [Pseudoteredinibacter isoporae]|uniref:Fibronectin type-III domain-containing protein n=1 Tax=Pseudoteredinibacter isoporae TaxID=570281 RepID=A0A7X0JS39_9GAMM|nr:protein-arginine deiminase family protein [Pseudoteredinibacter isoporae]MBB6521277.1 hypothetical protein [Pseudoteredinibacter isoporae]NHO86835.1 DNRLRE domain-containing protein [Pseudoteredinibacter isoporae]NIB24713.1 DNRLRE domain-containing protein [Pseudoteredinibacter isoporae]
MSQPKSLWFEKLTVLPLVFAVHSASAESITPIADGYTRGGQYANEDYSHQNTLIVKNSHNIDYDRKSYLSFDVSGQDIENAEQVILQLYAQKVHKNLTIKVSPGLSNWYGDLSWNTAPLANEDAGSVSINLNPEQSNNWIDIDLTQLLKGLNTDQLSLIIEDPNNGRGNGVNFHSIENTHAPQLVVTASQQIPAPNTVRVDYLDGQVVLDWQAPTLSDPQIRTTNITGYHILRRQDGDDQFSLLASSTIPEDTYYVDRSALPGERYHYQVSASAINTENHIDVSSEPSNEVTLQPYTENGQPIANLVTDANRDGHVNPDDNFGEGTWSSGSGATFGPNLNDDDGDGVADGRDDLPNGDDDLSDMAKVVLKQISNLQSGDKPQLEITYDVDAIPANNHRFQGDPSAQEPRFFYRYEQQNRWISLGEVMQRSGNTLSVAFPVDIIKNQDNTIYVDSLFGRHPGFNGHVKMVFKVIRGSQVISQDEVALRGAPILFSHVLQTPGALYISDPDAYDGVVDLYNTIDENLDPGINLMRTPAPSIWAQDAGQFGYSQKPTPKGLKTTAIDSRLPSGSNYWFGKLNAERGYLDFTDASSKKINSGGNLEVIPPYSHNGKDYPFGRLVIGGSISPDLPVQTNSGVDKSRDFHSDITDFFSSQEVQGDPIVLPSAWLTVGHIDEIFKILPNLNAGPNDRKWVIAIASPEKALEIDDRYTENNMAIQTHVINQIKETLKQEVGLTDDDFVDVPMLYTSTGSSYHANVVNMQAVGSDLYVPDPEARLINGIDPFKEAARAALAPLGYNIHFAPIGQIYFRGNGGGGIHCGTNMEFEGVTDRPWWIVED